MKMRKTHLCYVVQLHIERLDGRHIDYRKYQVHPSITSHVINDLLQNPIVSLYSAASTKFSNKELTFYEHNSLPCSVVIALSRIISSVSRSSGDSMVAIFSM
jgi:hypothetical protein